MRKNTLVGEMKKGYLWERLSPYFRWAEINEISDRLEELDDATLVGSLSCLRPHWLLEAHPGS